MKGDISNCRFYPPTDLILKNHVRDVAKLVSSFSKFLLKMYSCLLAEKKTKNIFLSEWSITCLKSMHKINSRKNQSSNIANFLPSLINNQIVDIFYEELSYNHPQFHCHLFTFQGEARNGCEQFPRRETNCESAIRPKPCVGKVRNCVLSLLTESVLYILDPRSQRAGSYKIGAVIVNV